MHPPKQPNEIVRFLVAAQPRDIVDTQIRIAQKSPRPLHPQVLQVAGRAAAKPRAKERRQIRRAQVGVGSKLSHAHRPRQIFLQKL